MLPPSAAPSLAPSPAPPPPPPVAVDPQKKPWGAAFSGGGWRAQGASIGFAKALWNASITQELNTISSVSGGSWFTTQYTFSSKFFDAVNDDAPEDLYKDWLEAYYTTVCIPSTGVHSRWLTVNGHDECETSMVTDVVSKAVSPFIAKYESDEIEQFLGAAERAHWVWEKFIGTMIDKYSPQLSTTEATPANRQGNLAADLLICTAMVGSGSIMSYNNVFSSGDITELLVDGAKAPALVPMAWQVPASGAGTEASWFSPQHSIDSMTVSKPGYWWWQKVTAALDLPNPNVGKVASMSSAAAAILGTEGFIEHVARERAIVGDWGVARFVFGQAGKAAQAVLNAANLQGMAPCSGENKGDADHPKCKFPSVRFADGGYADDSSIATNIAKMQREFTRETVLKVVALDSNPCIGLYNGDCHDGSRTLADTQVYNWGSLFKEAEDWAPRWHRKYIKSGVERMVRDVGSSENVVLNLNNQIFAEPFSAADMTGLRLDSARAIKGTATSKVSISQGRFTTIQNDAYGVIAGQQVDMLVVHINAALSTELIDSGEDRTKNFTDVAQSTYDSLVEARTFQKFFNEGN